MKLLIQFITFIFLAGILFHLSCRQEYSCENCRGGNKPPVAIAGNDTTIVLPADSVITNGSASFDPDGSITNYQWTKISGPAFITINTPSAARTVVKNLVAGSYRMELKVTDNDGLSAKDTMTITVDTAITNNHPPVANAGTDQTITLPTNSVNLDGSASFDPDNNITAYAWAKISGPSSFTITNTNAVQTPVTNLVQGVYQFELKVTDAGGLFSKDTMQITVNNPISNQPPIANAGSDTSFNYDLQTCSINPSSFVLNGSASLDPDGTIVSYLWTGPGTIVNPNSAIAHVSNLIPGTYQFILKVTDNNGATDNDTMNVNIVNLLNRPTVTAQLVPLGTLSQARPEIAVASAGNKILFAGGSGNDIWYSRVDIYDIATNTWSTAELSQRRSGMAVAALGNKIYLAGGDPSGSYTTSRIDIYDAIAGTWSTAELSQSRRYAAAGVVGNKILFAGGYYQIGYGNLGHSNVIDIYDGSTNTWSVGSLSLARLNIKAATAGNKLFFSGGAFNDINDYSPYQTIDIYDGASNLWSTSNLSEPKDGLAAIAAGNKIYWAGGMTYHDPTGLDLYISNSVEIRDVNTQTSSFGCLFQPNDYFDAVLKDNKIVFFTGGGAVKNKFDIYDIATNTWAIGLLNQNIKEAAIISVNNTIYVAGGYVNGVLSNQVWKLEF